MWRCGMITVWYEMYTCTRWRDNHGLSVALASALFEATAVVVAASAAALSAEVSRVVKQMSRTASKNGCAFRACVYLWVDGLLQWQVVGKNKATAKKNNRQEKNKAIQTQNAKQKHKTKLKKNKKKK